MVKERKLTFAQKPVPLEKAEITQALVRISGIESKWQGKMKEVARKREVIENEYQRQLLSVTPQNRKEASAIFERDRDSKLAELKKETSDARWNILRELNSAREDLSFAKQHYSNSRNLGTSYMLGTEERSRLMDELDRLGPAQISAMATVAKARSDKLLASCLALANDRLAKAARPFDSEELIDSVFSAEVAEANSLLRQADIIADRAILENKTFEGSAKPADRIKLGLNYGKDSVRTVDPADVPPRSMSAVDKIASALTSEDGSI